MLQIQRHALLVGVQGEEVAAVHAGLFGPAVAAGVALARLLHLDDRRAEPRQQLGARGARLELCQVQYANAIERRAHRSPSGYAVGDLEAHASSVTAIIPRWSSGGIAGSEHRGFSDRWERADDLRRRSA